MPDPLERFLLLARLSRLVAQTAQTAVDLSLLEAACLALAAQTGGGVTEAAASKALLVPRERVAPALGNLVAREHIQWERSRADRRTFAFRPTSKGADGAAFLDEAVAIAFIHTCRFLTEEGFDQVVGLLHQRFGCPAGTGSPDAREYLVPAAALGALGAWSDAAATAAAQRGLSSTQVALLVLLQRGGDALELDGLGAALGLSIPAVSLQGENLCEKGLVAWAAARDGLRLTENGGNRVRSVLAHGELARVSEAVRGGGSERGTLAAEESFDSLMSMLGYVFEGGEVSPCEGAPRSNAAASRPSALSALYALLGSLLSYPDRVQAEQRTAPAVLGQVRDLLAALGVGDALPVDVGARFEAWAAKDASARGRDLREEFTRLFYGYPRLVPTTGSHWVRRGRTEFSLARGERAAVGLEYRKLGLKNRPGSAEPFDALVSELDFLSYITSLEARAFEGGDAGSAREWELLRRDFCEHHFRELAFGVAQAIARHSDNPCLGLYAWLLGFVAAES